MKEVEEDVRAQNDRWRTLSPEARRTRVLKALRKQRKQARKNAVFLLILGVGMLAAGILFWYYVYHMSIMATLGFAPAIFLTMMVLMYAEDNRIPTYAKILSGHFTDNDLSAYLAEHEENNRKALHVERLASILVVLIGILALRALSASPYTKPLAIVGAPSTAGLMLIGIAAFVLRPFKGIER